MPLAEWYIVDVFMSMRKCYFCQQFKELFLKKITEESLHKVCENKKIKKLLNGMQRMYNVLGCFKLSNMKFS